MTFLFVLNLTFAATTTTTNSTSTTTSNTIPQITRFDANSPMEENVNVFNNLTREQSKAITESFTERECINPEVAGAQSAAVATANLPSIDIFINPARKAELTSLADSLIKSAVDFFTNSDMRLLYPQLFRILWQSTLPCVAGQGLKHAMIRSLMKEENIFLFKVS